MNSNVSRRSVAKGAAWAVPAITIGAPAALAAGSGVLAAASCYDTANVCATKNTYRAHLSGRTANSSNLYFYHGFTAGTDIPVGTVFTWTDTYWVKTGDVATQTAVAPKPNTQTDTYGTWAVLSISKGGVQTINGVEYTALSYTVTYTTSQIVPSAGSICSYVSTTPAYLRSNNVYPGVSISDMTMNAGTVTAGGGYTSAQVSTTAGTTAGGTCL